MYHPTRGGVRGGRDQFTWDDVKVDKHRENYLGHSIKAPVGRWQKGYFILFFILSLSLSFILFYFYHFIPITFLHVGKNIDDLFQCHLTWILIVQVCTQTASSSGSPSFPVWKRERKRVLFEDHK
ncbi:hypothetical protein CsSME_00027967 [Camellia sinensis var. sinensis]